MSSKKHRREGEHKLVQKSWGYEKWITNQEKYCGKLLYVLEGKCCSFHRHLIKVETFYVQQGKIKLEFGFNSDPVKAEVIILEAGDSFDVSVEQWHRFTSLDGYAVIYEFSTHHEDSDVERSL